MLKVGTVTSIWISGQLPASNCSIILHPFESATLKITCSNQHLILKEELSQNGRFCEVSTMKNRADSMHAIRNHGTNALNYEKPTATKIRKKKKKKKRKKKSSSPKRLERMKVIQFDRFFWTCLVGEQWVVFTRHWARAGGFMSFFFSFFFFLFCLFPWLLLFFWWHSAAVRGEYRSVIMQIVGESEQDQRRSTLGELTVFRHSFAYGHCRFIERSCKRWVWHPRIQHPTSRIQHPASAAFVC